MEFTMKDIYALIDKVRSSDLTAFSYRDAQTEIAMERGAGKHVAVKEAVCDDNAVMVQPETESTADDVILSSPMVGTFYAAPSEDEEPYVSAGDAVQKGQTVCILEAMKLMNEVESDCDGIVKEILVKNGQMVEYGQPLFRIEKRG